MIPVMDFAADLAPIYDTFGVPVTHTPAACSTKPVIVLSRKI
jgi:hypothetical protein